MVLIIFLFHRAAILSRHSFAPLVSVLFVNEASTVGCFKGTLRKFPERVQVLLKLISTAVYITVVHF